MITFVYVLGCLDVNHVNNNPPYYACDCVSFNDPCFASGGCVLEEECPESDGESSGIRSC